MRRFPGLSPMPPRKTVRASRRRSASRFPAVVQPFVRALPLTAGIDAMRGNMLQGLGFGHLGGQIATLAAWCVIPFAVSLKIFRWK